MRKTVDRVEGHPLDPTGLPGFRHAGRYFSPTGDHRPTAAMSAAPPRLTGWRGAVAGLHLMVSLAAGGIVGVVVAPLLGGTDAGLVAWVVMATVFLVWTWSSMWSLDVRDTAWLAVREDGSRPLRDLTLLAISRSERW